MLARGSDAAAAPRLNSRIGDHKYALLSELAGPMSTSIVPTFQKAELERIKRFLVEYFKELTNRDTIRARTLDQAVPDVLRNLTSTRCRRCVEA